jgi:hypothetical protein
MRGMVNPDPHGYRELASILRRVEEELRRTSEEALADAVAEAAKFENGSPSEFLGEARIALKKVLSVSGKVGAETRALAESTIERIDEGFRRVGGG